MKPPHVVYWIIIFALVMALFLTAKMMFEAENKVQEKDRVIDSLRSNCDSTRPINITLINPGGAPNTGFKLIRIPNTVRQYSFPVRVGPPQPVSGAFEPVKPLNTVKQIK
jgi:hypothetical protein